MEKDTDGYFYLEKHLETGEHLFAYKIDGERKEALMPGELRRFRLCCEPNQRSLKNLFQIDLTLNSIVINIPKYPIPKEVWVEKLNCR